MSDNTDRRQQGVRPIDPLLLHRIMERRPNEPIPANDREALTADPAVGGIWGIVIMLSIAIWIGATLAIGRAF